MQLFPRKTDHRIPGHFGRRSVADKHWDEPTMIFERKGTFCRYAFHIDDNGSENKAKDSEANKDDSYSQVSVNDQNTKFHLSTYVRPNKKADH